MIDKLHITGLILAGGRGTRMGGADKGLQPWRSGPLALQALQRLAPQVGCVAINANRHLADYEALGVPVWPDNLPGQPGPLAGFLVGLERCESAYLVTVPCDSPRFPLDLVERLAGALEAADAEVAVAAIREDGATRTQPVFCLMRAGLRDPLARFIDGGGRAIHRWTALQRCVDVVFDDSGAFANANTADDLQALAANDG